MIDKAVVEMLLHRAEAVELEGGWPGTVLYIAANDIYRRGTTASQMIPILTDYLAMREVVEALAASGPISTVTRFGVETYECRYCYRDSLTSTRAILHQSDCPYRRAVELIGPASERREEGE